MIKLVYCIRRRADLSTEEFNRYWWEEHGPKVKQVAQTIGARRYVQSHVCAPALNAELRASRQLAEPYDGITEVWWDSEEAMNGPSGSAQGIEAMKMLIKDESTFIDFARSSVFVTREREVFDFTREATP